MGKEPYLGLILLLAGQVPGLTATPEGLGVRQHPPSLCVMRGETATLSCHFQVESRQCGVQWFKKKSAAAEKQLIRESPGLTVVKENRSSSLEISRVALEDGGWYFCQVNVLQRDPEWGNGTELNVVSPPSTPQIYLQIPPDPVSGRFALVCLSGGFHPSRLSLTWTSRSAAADIDFPSVTNCTLPAVDPPADPSERPAEGTAPPPLLLSPDRPSGPACFQVTDSRSQEVYLFSVVLLPPRQSLYAGVTFTCGVQDHPALSAESHLTASFTWDAPPNEMIVHLNVLKMCFLSAITVMFLFEGNTE